MRATVRFGLVVVAAVLLALTAAPAAQAQTDADLRDQIVVITGRAEVGPDETVDTVVIVDGPVVVDGTVTEQVIALHGDVLVSGTVEEEVVAIDGRVLVRGSGRIGGDVVSRHRPVIQDEGTIDGSWERWDVDAFRRGITVGSQVAFWIAVSVSTLILGLVLGLLAPRAAAAVAAAGRGNPGAAAGWGFLLAVGLPVAAVLVMLTLVGLPLGLGLLGALGLVYSVAYVAGAWLLGRTVASGAAPVLAFLAGWAILRIVALVPVLGGLVSFLAVVAGLGALAVAGYRARGRSEAGTVEPSPVPGSATG